MKILIIYMNESNQLIRNYPIPKLHKKKLNLIININKSFIKHNYLRSKCKTLFIKISLIIILLILLLLIVYKKEINNSLNNLYQIEAKKEKSINYYNLLINIKIYIYNK